MLKVSSHMLKVSSLVIFQLIVAYKDLMVKTAMLLGANNKANVVKQMNKVLQFERNLAKIYEPKGKLKDSEKIYNKMTIADLQQMAPSVRRVVISFHKINITCMICPSP